MCSRVSKEAGKDQERATIQHDRQHCTKFDRSVACLTLTLPDDEIHVWRVMLSAWNAYEQVMKDILVDEERSRADRFYFHADFSRFILTRALLRCILSRCYLKTEPRLLVFGKGARGKPFLRKPSGSLPLFFNVAHSGDWSLIAVARREVGVDIERFRPDIAWEELSCRVFSPEEQVIITKIPFDRRLSCFFSTWARKEAYLKARGDGFVRISPHEFSVFVDSDAMSRSREVPIKPMQEPRWLMRDIHVGTDYAAAVVAGKPDWTLRTFDGDPKTLVPKLRLEKD